MSALLRDLEEGRATARAVVAACRGGEVSAAQVAEAMLARVEQVEPWLKAFAHLDSAQVRATSGAVPDGPLAGVPLAVKDVFDTCDMPTEYGSAAHRGWRPEQDAVAVHLARRAGALIMGKTVTTEFATMAPGATVNPFDQTRTPGGSSSGSAAALGAGIALLAFGTQTSGSTIRPSAFCGVVGCKPSPGMIARHGMKPLAESLDAVGPMARDARDLALLMSVLTRRPGFADVVELEGAAAPMRLFLPQHEPAADPAPLEQVAGLLGQVRLVATPDWWQALGEAQADVFAWEASANLAAERDLNWDRLQPLTHTFLHRHDGITAARWQAGIAARDAALARIDMLFGGDDFLMTFAAPGEAPVGLTSTGSAEYNLRWTLLGLPAVTLPIGMGPSGLPLGMQIIGRPGRDAALLAQAVRVEGRLRAAGLAPRPELAGGVPA